MPVIRILEEYCKGCGLCVSVCAKQNLEMSERVNDKGLRVVEVVDQERCTGCLNCALMCPDAAIEISYVRGEEEAEPAIKERTD